MKRLSVILCLALLLCACGESAETPVLTDAPKESAPETEFNVLDTLESADFDDADFIFLQQESSIRRMYEYVAEQDGEVLNDTVYKRNLEIEERYRVKISAIGDEKPSERVVRDVLAEEEAPYQVVCDWPHSITKQVLTGSFRNLYTVPTLDLSQYWWSREAVDVFTIQDKLYLVSGDIVLFEKERIPVFIFNRDMADKYGLGNLYRLVDEGKWTIDRMNGFVKATTEDLNGDGEMEPTEDQFGLISGSYTYTTFMLDGMGCSFSSFDADGEVKLGLTDDHFLGAMERMGETVYSENVLWAEELTNNWKDYSLLPHHIFEEGKGLFYHEVLQLIRQLDTNINYGVLPQPKYDEAQENYLSSIQYAISGSIAIPANNNKNIEMTGFILDAMGALSHYTTLPTFVEIVLQAKKAPDTESAEIVAMLFENITYDRFCAFNLGDILKLVYKNIYEKKGEGYVSMIEANTKRIMKQYETFLEKYEELA